jgi:predicted component of type VI protein secretion system
VIDDPWVSRRHAEIISTHDSYLLRDLASSNGTFLTDRLIDTSDYGLQDGDHVRLGQSDVQLVFRFSGAATRKMAPRNGGEGGHSPASRRARQAVKPDYQAPASASDTSGPDGVTVREERESAEELVEGEVRLKVEAGGDVRLLYQFVHELRQKPEFSVLRMSGGPTQDMAVWLDLGERLALRPLLSRMKFVSEVSRGADPPTGGRAAENVFSICLAI